MKSSREREPLFESEHFHLHLWPVDGSKNLAGLRIGDVLGLWVKHVEDHPLAYAVRTAAIDGKFSQVQDPCYPAFDRWAFRHLDPLPRSSPTPEPRPGPRHANLQLRQPPSLTAQL